MPSRKQRRRRRKEQRHEYEVVYVDAEGNEIAVDEAEASPNGKAERPRDRSERSRDKGSRPAGARPGRTVEPASWRRAVRRGVLFAPFMLAVLYLLNRDVPPVALVINTFVLLAFFIPFGYLMDKVMYRAFERRAGGAASSRRGRT